ncbi:MAG: CRISPR-associated helicase Cas3' [Candidatus Cloacimonas sp.]|jgi:CRISPR-associated endonuclease/helicase Cas3|nr:CRISPR-associated helicase Cas3' [Candidatus Cloacimonas sp.]
MVFKLYSHPDLLLKDHLEQVLTTGYNRFIENNIYPEFTNLLRVVLCFHDLGKGSRYFQDYLINHQNRNNLCRHSELSAIWAYWICKNELDMDTLSSLMAYACVVSHHGDLANFKEILAPQLTTGELISISQAMDYIELNQILKVIGIDHHLSHDKFIEIMSQLAVHPLSTQYRKVIRSISSDSWVQLNYIYSLLIWADKYSAIFSAANIVNDRPKWRSCYVEKYVTSLQTSISPVIDIRNKAFVLLASNVDPYKMLYSINMPTGTGKTLSSLRAAQELKAQNKSIQRIIYCLPFTSIIDQNQKVFENILAYNGIENSSDFILAHHHLAEFVYSTLQSEYNANESEYLVETWESELIITTFVQLLASCLSIKNHNLKRFHRLANAVIIFDEIQNIPHKYWSLLSYLFNVLAGQLRTYIILVTATLPLIYDPDTDFAKELASEKVKWFRSLNRIIIDQFQLNIPLEIEELAKIIYNDYNKNDKQNRLVILNTIKSSLELFKLLLEMLPGVKLEYLSSNVIPKHRLQRINQIRNSPQEGMIIVSTQVVEAGVDIDVDVVYRDLAPLDSLIQASGRCNRNASKVMGLVILFQLHKNSHPYWRYVYDETLVQSTLSALSKMPTKISESDIYDLSNAYYCSLKELSSLDVSREIINNLRGLNLCSALSDNQKAYPDAFHLFDELPTKTVFVECDYDATKLLLEFQSIDEKEFDDVFQERIFKKNLIRKMSPYMINVPSKLLQTEDQIFVIDKDSLSMYYDLETGFKREPSITDYIF